jgi:TatD DNase family protein
LIFDSHAHYDDEAFDEDRDEVLRQVRESVVSHIIDAGSNIESSKKAIELAKKYDFLYAAVGVHPEDAGGFDENSISILEELAQNKKVVAIGEIGLDYYYEDKAEDVLQKQVFEKQIELAIKLNLPIIVHDREAHKDTFDIIKKYSKMGLRGVLHCYSGSVEMVREYVKLGFFIGFGGVITFKNAKKSLEVLKEVPIENILIETDCPYLSPVPFRGKRNDSRNLKYVVAKASEVLGIEQEFFEKKTEENAKRLFGID